MKKGFTLIELLVVMVVLAIIALITVPNALRMIDEAARRADIASVRGLVKAGEEYFLKEITDDGEFPFETNIYEFVNINGKRPDSAVIMIRDDQEIYIGAVYNNRCYIKDYNSIEVIVSENADDCVDDTLGFSFFEYNTKSWSNRFQILLSKTGRLFLNKSIDYQTWNEVYFEEENVKIKKVFAFSHDKIFVIDSRNRLHYINYSGLYGYQYLEDVKDVVSTGAGTYFFVMMDGRVMSEGSSRAMVPGSHSHNTSNLIGYSTANNFEGLEYIPGLTNVNKIVADRHTAYAILNSGQVMVWGNNLGGAEYDYIYSSPNENEYTPIISSKFAFSPKLIPSLNNVKEIYAVSEVYQGDYPKTYDAVHPVAYAILNDGTVRVWGSNANGRLGLGITNESHFQETPIINSYLQGAEKFTFLRADGHDFGFRAHAYMIDTNGGLYVWGIDSDTSDVNSLTFIPNQIANSGIKEVIRNAEDDRYLSGFLTTDGEFKEQVYDTGGGTGGGTGESIAIDWDYTDTYFNTNGVIIPLEFFSPGFTPIARIDELSQDIWNMLWMPNMMTPEEWKVYWDQTINELSLEYGVDENYIMMVDDAIWEYVLHINSSLNMIDPKIALAYLVENNMQFPDEYSYLKPVGYEMYDDVMLCFLSRELDRNPDLAMECFVEYEILPEEMDIIINALTQYLSATNQLILLLNDEEVSSGNTIVIPGFGEFGQANIRYGSENELEPIRINQVFSSLSNDRLYLLTDKGEYIIHSFGVYFFVDDPDGFPCGLAC